MAFFQAQHIQPYLRWATLSLGVFYAVILAQGFGMGGPTLSSLQGRVIQTQESKNPPWKLIEQQEVIEGATIPSNSYVVFHLPNDGFRRIEREVLFGLRGKEVRYWGYCFPQNYDSSLTANATGLPGKLFLSEREREYRKEIEEKRHTTFSIFNPPTKKQIQKGNTKPITVRHQVETFVPGIMCFIMTEKPLSIGLDIDSDKLNRRREMEAGTNPELPDTDGDGIWDGIEVLYGTNPLIRDTDSDGIIDGLEDQNWNGEIDPGETDPRERDTDRDDLCDGLCRVKLADGREILLGEDVNLNGIQDDGETSPLSKDTDGDGALDYQAFFNCQLGLTEYCL